MRFIEQGKPLYVSKVKVTKRESEFCAFNWLLLVYKKPGHGVGITVTYKHVTGPESVKFPEV